MVDRRYLDKRRSNRFIGHGSGLSTEMLGHFKDERDIEAVSSATARG